MFLNLKSHVRGQNGGSFGCPAQLDHFQVACMCISCVYTCPPDIKQNEATKACEV